MVDPQCGIPRLPSELAEKKPASKKSKCYYIVMLELLEIVKDIFENGKLSLNLNSIRGKKL